MKKPWYLRFPPRLADLVGSERRAADTTGGYAHEVKLTFALPEPGRGSGPSAPTRDVIARLDPADARRLALRLLAEAGHVDREEAEASPSDTHHPVRTELWAPEPDEPGRRMDTETATQIHAAVLHAAAWLSRWVEANPKVGDYRVDNAAFGLSKAARAMANLVDDATPELDRAQQALDESGFFSGHPTGLGNSDDTDTDPDHA